MSAPSLYEQLVAADLPIDNHESDLYVELSNESRRIVVASGLGWSLFLNACTGTMWIEVPFAFSPWWEARQK